MSEQAKAAMEIESEVAEPVEAGEIEGTREISATELKAIAEALTFVAEEPLDSKSIAKVLRIDQPMVEEAIQSLVEEYNTRSGGLQFREIGGGLENCNRSGDDEQGG